MFKKETAGDIYPEYYILRVNKFNDNMKDRLDEWVYFFKHTVIKEEFKAKGLDKARKILDRNKLSPEEQKNYDYAQQQRIDAEVTVESSKLEGIEIGKEIGIEVGIEIGKEKGKEEGEEGRVEREKLAEELKEREKEIERERKEREEREKELFAEIARLKQK
jgi:hypothetical protein